MTGYDDANPTSMRPAVMVGGQRRRIARRSNMPRSNTTPALAPEPAPAVNSASAVAAESGVHRPGATYFAPPLGPLNMPMQFHVATSGLAADARPSPTSRPSNGSSGALAAQSPTPSTASGSTTTATEGKKKHGLFGFKTKDQDGPRSSHVSPLQQSPLPPLTPVKAAQLLGVDAGAGRARSGSVGRQNQHDGIYEGLPDATSRQTKFREEGIEPDPPKLKKFLASSNKKAQRMLGLLPPSTSISKRAANLERAAAASLARHSEEDTETTYSSEPDLHARPRLPPPAARPAPEVPKRRMRKKGPKSLDRMAPITETSHDELRTSYRDSEHNTELDVISEYEHDHPLSSAPLPRSHTESTLTTDSRYELEDDDLSPTDDVIDETPEAEAEGEDRAMHPGTQVDLNMVKWQQPAVVHLRGPLQTVEDCLLDAAEQELEAQKAKLDQHDTTKLKMDSEVAALRASHEKMKRGFEAAKHRIVAQDEPEPVSEAEDSEDDEDLISICSSIGLDEEPTLRVAKAMAFTRITPGMVKIVDIPPRKKKAVEPAAPVSTPVVSGEGKPAYYFEHDERVSPFNERSENVEPTVLPGRLQAQHYNRVTKGKKAKMPRDESRMLVQDWISTNDPATQRPVSERIDPDVLADQQIPPAPFPKEGCVTPPPRISSKQHFCLSNGHIFHPIDLKTVPDEVAINSLEVRPYLQTSVGVKQHVRVPVRCHRCGEDVKEELWECELPVCRMVVCKECADDMEAEWQERAIGSWEK